MPHFMSLERFSETQSTSPFVVQVGAMDGKAYDPLYPYLSEGNWRGLLVEPLPDMYAQLQETYKDCDRIRFVNVAIADPESIDSNGQIKMMRPDPAKIADNSLPVWARGIATLADRPAYNAMGHPQFN